MRSVSVLIAILSFVFSTASYAGNREHFATRVLPDAYPEVIGYLERTGPIQIEWAAETGGLSGAEYSLSRDGAMVMRTRISSPSGPVDVVVIDQNLNTRPDYATYYPQGMEAQEFEDPTDDTTNLLWDVSMAMIYRNCCR